MTETKHHVPADLTMNARRLALVLEDGLRGRSTIRISRERGIPELRVNAILKAHGHPQAKPLRDAVAYLLSLPADQSVTVELGPRPQPEPPTAPVAASSAEGEPGWENDPRPGAKARLVTVLTRDVHPDKDNPREHLDGIEELADSIRSAGLLQPIVARRHEGRLVVVAGHRRLAAVQHLGWDSVQVIIRADMRPDDVLAAMLIENGQRTDLDPIEEARALRRLKAQMGDVSDAALAARIGRTNGHVTNRLILLSLTPAQQDEIRDGTMTLTEATTLARVASGRVRPRAVGRPGVGHLTTVHPLAPRAKARCLRLGHSRGQGKGVGGVACGECWESVIRADERDHLNAHSGKTGKCVLCDAPMTVSTT